jgi:hypothetical protein
MTTTENRWVSVDEMTPNQRARLVLECMGVLHQTIDELLGYGCIKPDSEIGKHVLGLKRILDEAEEKRLRIEEARRSRT